MTICGLLRLDGADARRSTLTAMLAASSWRVPAARGVHVDGPFAVLTAVGSGADPLPPIAVDRSGLVVVLEGRPATVRNGSAGPSVSRTSRRGASSGRAGRSLPPAPASQPLGDGRPVGIAGVAGTDACLLAAAYRTSGDGSLTGLGDSAAVVWEPSRRRLVVARTGFLADDLVTWSDGRVFAFGTEPAQVLAVCRIAPGRTDAGGMGAAARRPRLARIRQLAAGDRITVTAAAPPRRVSRAWQRTASRADAGLPLG
jgi:hypothetical protein